VLRPNRRTFNFENLKQIYGLSLFPLQLIKHQFIVFQFSIMIKNDLELYFYLKL